MGDHKGPLPALPHPRPYGTIPLPFVPQSSTLGICLFYRNSEPSALWPPTYDAAGEHEQTAEPDQGRQGIDKDANSSARRALPVGKEDIDIGQAKGGDRDLARGLILKVLVELAARVNITQQATVLPDLQLGVDGIHARRCIGDVAKERQLVASDVQALPRLEDSVSFHLEVVRADDAHSKQHKAEVNQVAPVAAPVT